MVPSFGAASYPWVLAVIAGAIGLWPALIGLVLGLVSFLIIRREGGSTRLARWAMILAVMGPLASGAGMLVLYIWAWAA